MREKANQRHIRSGCSHALDGLKRLVARIEVHHDEFGSCLGNFGEQRVWSGTNAQVDYQMVGSFDNLRLEEKIIHQG